jgi:hypothetical protein
VTVTGASAADISANPNPVTCSGGVGTTNISWATGDGGQGQVWVAVNGGAESLFGQGATGSQDAPWITCGNSFRFRLYAGTSHSILLDEVIVTGS